MTRLGYFAGAILTVIFLTACGSGTSSPAGSTIPATGSTTNHPGAHGYHVLYRFKGGIDGYYPFAGVIATSTGVVFGTALGGGAYGSASGGYGTVFEVSPSGKSTLYSFKGGADGIAPQGGLTAGSGGVMYGTTDYGGGSAACSPGCGTVYALTPTASGYSERVIYAFQGGNDGALPLGNVVVDGSGAIYGTTVAGGGAACATSTSIGCGTVFKLTPSGSGYSESVLHAFQAGSDGVGPRGALTHGLNGLTLRHHRARRRRFRLHGSVRKSRLRDSI